MAMRKGAFFGSRLGRRLLGRILLFSGGVAVVLTAIQLYADYCRDVDDLNASLALAHESHSEAVIDAIWQFDANRLDILLRALVAQPYIAGARVQYGADAQEVVTVGATQPGSKFVSETALSYAAGSRSFDLGMLTVYGDVDAVYERSQSRFLMVLATQLLKTMLVAAFIILIVDRLIGARLQKASRWAADLTPDKPFAPLTFAGQDRRRPDEIDDLAGALNKTADTAHRHAERLEEAVAARTRALSLTNRQLSAAVATEARLRADLKKETDMKSRFFGLLAHDMRNQVTPILGMSELLTANTSLKDDDQAYREALSINRSAQALLRLLESILEWTRLQMDFETAQPESQPFRDICVEAMADAAVAADAKGVSLVISGENPVVHVDASMTTTILRNLLNNGVKFSHSGSAVEVEAVLEDGQARIHVLDRGVGVPEEARETLFTDGHNHTQSGTAGEKGSGLGLALSAELVRRQGGEIGMEPRAGGGADFWFTVPLANASANDHDRHAGVADHPRRVRA